MEENISEKLLDAVISKYDLVQLSAIYFHALKNKHEFDALTVPELIAKSLNDILNGSVTAKDIRQMHAKKQMEALSLPQTASESAHKKSSSDEKQKKRNK